MSFIYSSVSNLIIQGSPTLQSTVDVTVTAASLGTSRPTFNNIPTGLAIDENTSLNSTVTTVTAQSSNGASVTYSIAGGNTGNVFAVKSGTGRIYVRGEVDYELMTEYRLWIEATQGGASTGSSFAEVVIAVRDKNDNDPKFSQTVYEASIKEDRPFGSSVITVTATDADSNVNGDVTYSLSGKDADLFRINAAGKIATFTALDRETVDLYSLTVTATDNVSNSFVFVINHCGCILEP